MHNLCVKYALFLLGKYLGIELLGHMISAGLYVNLLKKLSKCFLSICTVIKISQSFGFQQLTVMYLGVAFFVYILLKVVKILEFIS